MKIGKFFFFCFFLISLNAFGDGFVAASGAEEFLGQHRIDTLQRARNGGYRVSILSGNVSGIDRVAVIVGEDALKNYSSAGTGEKLASLFTFRGLEGIQLSNDWSVLAVLPINIAMLPFNAVVRLGGLLVDKELTQNYINLNNATHATENLITVKPDDCRTANAVNILLESGSSDIATIAALGSMPLALGVEIAYLALLNSSPSLTLQHVVGLTAILYSVTQASHFLYKHFNNVFLDNESKTLSPYIFPLSYWMNDYRTSLMVGNTIKAFQNRPEEQLMLIIAEYHREPGIKRLLRERFDFNDITKEIFEDREH
ncbi:hypothetical protein [uncultured Endozoicomonas sp.]|uniref:hypothetical protein n=1 Tax=uncultured Endozoicomonas sp. TaxID=432652 RepID=UPI0026287B8F|nr:hypothetical protein [uncultured Endozoicomonas sp.]